MLLFRYGNVPTVLQVMENGFDSISGNPRAAEPGLGQNYFSNVIDTGTNEKTLACQDTRDSATSGLQIEIVLEEGNQNGREHFPGFAASAAMVTRQACVIEHVVPACKKAFICSGRDEA